MPALKKKIKLCFIHEDLDNIFIRRWVAYFADHPDYQLFAITEKPSTFKGVKTYTLPRSAFHIPKVSFLLQITRINSLLNELQPDIVHVHFLTGLAYAIPFIPQRYKIALTVWGSDIFIYPHRNPLLYYFTVKALLRADLITGNAQHLLNACERLVKKRLPNAHVQRWGVDEKLFGKPVTPLIDPHRRREHFPIITHTRGLTPVYNVTNLLKALVIVLQRYPSTLLLMCHYGDGHLRKKMEALITGLGLRNNVQFLDHVNYEHMPHFLSCGDIAISIPVSDAGGESNLEALACGLPLILSDIPSYREQYSHDHNAYFVAHRDPASIAQGILTLAQDQRKRELLSANGKELVRSIGLYNANMKLMDDLYKKMVIQ